MFDVHGRRDFSAMNQHGDALWLRCSDCRSQGPRNAGPSQAATTLSMAAAMGTLIPAAGRYKMLVGTSATGTWSGYMLPSRAKTRSLNPVGTSLGNSR